jgi:hypothetical protein
MPRKIQDFAQQSLINPILVNVGRAGAANLDVIQEVEYVKQEAKMVYLLECLQKTPPPVIIFSDNKNEVDGELRELNIPETAGGLTYLAVTFQISKSTSCSRASRQSLFTVARVSIALFFEEPTGYSSTSVSLHSPGRA